MTTPAEVLSMLKEKEVKFVDLRFMDFPGLWQHTTVPISELRADSFSHGFGFDGSSIRGWQAINEAIRGSRAAAEVPALVQAAAERALRS